MTHLSLFMLKDLSAKRSAPKQHNVQKNKSFFLYFKVYTVCIHFLKSKYSSLGSIRSNHSMFGMNIIEHIYALDEPHLDESVKTARSLKPNIVELNFIKVEFS